MGGGHPQFVPYQVFAVVKNPITMTRTPAVITRPGMDVGEHTEEVLAEAGLPPEEIRSLLAAGPS